MCVVAQVRSENVAVPGIAGITPEKCAYVFLMTTKNPESLLMILQLLIPAVFFEDFDLTNPEPAKPGTCEQLWTVHDPTLFATDPKWSGPLLRLPGSLSMISSKMILDTGSVLASADERKIPAFIRRIPGRRIIT